VYTWKRPAGLSRRMVAHIERLSLEDSFTWTTGAGTVSSIPVRGTFHHSSDIEVSRFFTLGIWGKAAAGLETTTGAAGRLEYPSVGFEMGVSARFRF